MTITRREFYVGLVAVAILIIAAAAYVSSAKEVARAEQVKNDVQKQIADLRGDLKDTLAAIAKDREQAKTPQQIVQALPKYVELPKPIYIQPPSTIPSSGPTGLPEAPVPQQGSLVVPPESISAFWAHETACKEDGIKLAECQKEVPLLEQRAAAAEKAMKGGSFWHKAGECGLRILVPAAIGGAFGGEKGAIAGGGAGGASCFIKF